MMNRRHFLSTLGFTGAAALGGSVSAASGAAPPRLSGPQGGDSVTTAPGPGSTATTYDAVVPDTLDLAERAQKVATIHHWSLLNRHCRYGTVCQGRSEPWLCRSPLALHSK